MRSLGNLPAAAQLMDRFRLRDCLPPLDPELVAASARQRAKAHLVMPIPESRIAFVDDVQALRRAQDALWRPPRLCDGRRGATPGVSCVGLDVENSPTTNRAVLLQVVPLYCGTVAVARWCFRFVTALIPYFLFIFYYFIFLSLLVEVMATELCCWSCYRISRREGGGAESKRDLALSERLAT